MLIPPRNIQALACCAGACLQSFWHLGKFQPAKWGNFNRRKLGNIQPTLTQNGRAEPALPKVQRFSGFVTANEHEDQTSSSYRQDAADQNQFSWHKFSCRLC